MRDPRFLDRYGQSRDEPPANQVEQAHALARELALGTLSREATERTYDAKMKAAYAVPWPAFINDFARVLDGDEARRHAWIEFLGTEILSMPWNPIKVIPGPFVEDWLQGALEAWQTEIDPFEVWGSRYYDHGSWHIEDHRYFLLALLGAIDTHAFCGVLDRLPSPVLMHPAFWSYTEELRQDREQIELFLSLAPPVFDAEGQWLPSHPILALLLVDEIVAHAKLLRDVLSARRRNDLCTDLDLRALEREELPTWMRKMFGVLLKRSDGKTIALALLGRYAKTVLHSTPSAPEDWSAEEHALQALTDILRASSVHVSDVRRAWEQQERYALEKDLAEKKRRKVKSTHEAPSRKQEGEGARTLRSEGLPLLFGASRLLVNNRVNPTAVDAKPGEIEMLHQWLDELLNGRDPFIRYQGSHGDSFAGLSRLLGLVLAQQTTPIARLKESYRSLEPQRRRHLFAYQYEDFDSNATSAFLLRTGQYMAVHWSARDQNGARELFWWLYDAARRLWLTSTVDWVRTGSEMVHESFEFLPLLFRDDLEGALKRALRPIANSSELVVRAANHLLWNSIPPEQLPYLFHQAGVNLEQAIRDAHQWATLTDSPFPPEQQTLPDQLGIRLGPNTSADAPPPPSERTLLLPIFTRSLPFGAALLTRLEQDAFSITHIACLSQWTTWLLQVSVPQALRDRLGLSPELRILAVHGQVRGADLRQAFQDPERSSLADPDLITVISEHPDLENNLPMLAGPFGQRILWQPQSSQFPPFDMAFQQKAPGYDLFDYRDPVRGSAHVGRESLVEDISRRLVQGEALGVVGLRKVGKSSLFRAVAQHIDPIGARLGMFESLSVPLPRQTKPEALLISLDVQGISSRTLDTLLGVLCDELLERLELAALSIPSELQALVTQSTMEEAADIDRLRLFGDLLRFALHHTVYPLCFVFDEYDLLFEGYEQEPEIPGIERLLAFLRAEANATRRISLAFIGRDPRFLDRPHLAGRTNPLAGWAKPIFLGCLERSEADVLLCRLGKRMGLVVGRATLDDAWEWTGGHPMLVRQYGAALVELLQAQAPYPWASPTDPLVPKAGRAFYRRYMAEMICSEVQALLQARFTESRDLLEALCLAWPRDVQRVLDEWGGRDTPALDVLKRFGIVRVEAGDIWIPQVFREWFAPAYLRKRRVQRSAAGE